MEDGEKTCPQCAETVKAAAVKCRFCGYDFGGATPPPPPPESKSGGKAIGCIVIAILMVAIFIWIGSMAPSGDASGEAAASQGATTAPPVEITSRELAQAYEANEAAAQQRYGDANLAVTGTITSIDLDFLNEPVLMLDGTNEFQSVHAKLGESSRAKAPTLSKGQRVTVTCPGVGEVIGTPILRDCQLP